MNTTLVLAVWFAAAAIVPSLADAAAAKAARSQHLMLVEASGPSPSGRDTAVLADAESNGPSKGGNDTAQA